MKNIVVRTTSQIPIYQQLYDQISSQILNGDLKSDSLLPSIRGMAKELRVSIITIKKTWELLERNEYIYTIKGKGSYVKKNTKASLDKKKFDTIKKSQLSPLASKAYQAEAVNIWEGVVENTECIKTVLIKIGIEEEALMRRDGLTWTDTDQSVVDAPIEIALGECTGQPVYDNHVITKAIWEKINANDSQFYLAKVKITGGAALADAAAIDAHIAANKAANTDGNPVTDTATLTLIIEGKPAAARNYKDLDVNYIFPRGAKLFPSILLNGGDSAITLTETQEITYQLGAGADLRAEEFESLSLYTNLNHYPQLHDGIATDDLVFQFENGKEYSTVDFEFFTEKVNKNDGDKRSFGVMLASETPSVYNALVALFKA